MAERAETAKAQLKLRLKEPLRAQLEEIAKESGYSLNSEIVRRLEASLRDEKLGEVIFGSSEIFGLVDLFARLIRSIEIATGNREVVTNGLLAARSICRILEVGPQLVATGNYPGGIRDVTDLWASAAIERMLKAAVEQRAEE